ncbi:hypothetical protein ACJQWK_01053 [Exserohilum turcicum]|uniref:Ubiquitin-like protease family profile domain-containing protein n=1 Tax=Exserohilum turcicum (strain 28A) TaxID=671987 RepID=R0IFG2_EXST2|nr:uncharacterized protein SETTUDRAFT_21156 [Exserohilum turcica Et28A]EOA83806.1 hypothetical protein SETTUDRAFT_21156 [Exserohilum turcica Et28A]
MSGDSDDGLPESSGAFEATIEASFEPMSSSPSIPSSPPEQTPAPAKKKTDAEILSAWLSQFLVGFKTSNDVTVEISMREFLEITNTDTKAEGSICYLEQDSIDMALALLTYKYERGSDVCVLRAYEGTELLHIGQGAYGVDDVATDKQLLSSVRNPGKRWIIVPVSDGMLKGEAAEAVFKKPALPPTIATTTAAAKKGGGETTLAPYGIHWGLLVVDKKTRLARWIDSSLELDKSHTHTGKRFIRHMLPTGKAAAFVLHGIERILLGPQCRRRAFSAKTAKYVPHQFRDNSFKSDPGASCGPYLVAFLEYLYANPRFLVQLASAFRVEKWKTHRRDLAFDSLRTRVAMQEMIQRKSEMVLRGGEKPLRMTAEVFELLRPKVLAPLVATAWRAYEGRRDNVEFDNFYFGGEKRIRRGGGGGGTDGSSGTGGDGDTGSEGDVEFGKAGDIRYHDIVETDSEDADDSFLYSPTDINAVRISKQLLRAEIRGNPQNYMGIPTKDLKYKRAFELLQAAALAAESSKLTTNPPEPSPALSTAPPRRSRHPILQYPDGIEEAPSDFADATQVPPAQVKQWRRENLESIQKCQLGAKATHDGLSVRAILQVLSGATFTQESDYRLQHIWIHDPEVFSPHEREHPERLLPGVIAQRLRDRYEIFGMTDLAETQQLALAGNNTRKRGHGDGDGEEEQQHVVKKPKTTKTN